MHSACPPVSAHLTLRVWALHVCNHMVWLRMRYDNACQVLNMVRRNISLEGVRKISVAAAVILTSAAV